MTSFRLNAGRPARYQTGGPSARPAEEAVEITPIPRYAPNTGHDDYHLACGCTIPWPVIVEFGGHLHGQILCSEHGYQPKITKTELARIRKEAKKCQSTLPLSTLDQAPY